MNEIKKVSSKKLNEFGFIEEGIHYWWASWFATALGYSSLITFRPVIRKAMNSCDYLEVSTENNFIKLTENRKAEYKLTKFACLLIAMHADQRKQKVKKARIFFSSEMEDYGINLFSDNLLERIMANETLIRMQKQLNRVATRSLVKDHQSFTNEGYLGLYNKTATEIREYKGYQSKMDLSDQMSLTELLANMMRVSLTTDALIAKKLKSEKYASTLHRRIGQQMRELVKSCTGKYPETLQSMQDLNITKRKINNMVKTYNLHEKKLLK